MVNTYGVNAPMGELAGRGNCKLQSWANQWRILLAFQPTIALD